MKLLPWLWKDPAWRHAEVLPLPGELVPARPDLGHHPKRLLHDLPCDPRVNAEAELLVGTAASQTDLDPSAGQVVDHRDPLGQLDGIVVG